MLGHSLVVDFCHIALAACLTVSPVESPVTNHKNDQVSDDHKSEEIGVGL